MLESKSMLLRTMKYKGPCFVCNAPASGRNFSAPSCAACCAFFRRSIAEGKMYSCNGTQKCDVTSQMQRTCRYCRFQKCLDIGMLPEKVKRSTPTPEDWRLSPSNNVRSHNDPEYLDQLLLKRQELENMRLLHYGHLFDGELQMNSKGMDIMRAILQIPRAATYHNLDRIERVERDILWNYLHSYTTFQQLLITDKVALFQNFSHLSRSAEIAFATVYYGGLESNAIYLLDASFVECKHMGFKRIFTEVSHLYADPDFIARTYLPPMQFIMENIAPSIEAINLDETEIAALFNLLLWDSASVELTPEGKLLVDRQRQQLLTDLSQYYEAQNIDMSLRFGNLCLLLAPIKEQAHMRQEMNQIVNLLVY